ncbi:unnamed protein product [Auanema sp. JU1783]|nr:unnamed protein product [Auanema sp. JU1783]
MAAESGKVNQLLKKYGVFIECPYDKVRCVLTGHELKPTVSALEVSETVSLIANEGYALQEYIKSPKFQSAYDVHQILMENPDVFEELNKNLLGCKYTRRVLSRDRQTLLNHLNGKLFLRKKAKG